MILYLAGPISGDLEEYRLKFDAAASYLEAWKGHRVLNPASLPEGMEYEAYMRIGFAMLDEADGIVMLEGWHMSPGAMRELQRASGPMPEGYSKEDDRWEHCSAYPKKIFMGIEAVPFEKECLED